MNRRTREEDIQEFWCRVAQTATCWIWTGAVHNKMAYGRSWWHGKETLAHRVSWVIHNGEIANDSKGVPLLVLHKCDNPTCVRPDHLLLGTNADNSADMASKGRAASGENHGTHLHPESLKRGDQHWSSLNPEAIVKGSEIGTAKLTEAQVYAIKEATATGEAQITIAARYGVSTMCIRRITQGVTWKHVVYPAKS